MAEQEALEAQIDELMADRARLVDRWASAIGELERLQSRFDAFAGALAALTVLHGNTLGSDGAGYAIAIPLGPMLIAAEMNDASIVIMSAPEGGATVMFGRGAYSDPEAFPSPAPVPAAAQ